MNRILLATHNPAKSEEFKSAINKIAGNKIQLLTLSDVGVEDSPDETGITFKENAYLKAKYYYGLTGLPTLSDDGGLVIPALNNEPGVKSNRWLGYQATDEELIRYTLYRMDGLKDVKRKGYLELCLCYFNGNKIQTRYAEERIYGHIALKPSKKTVKGFPYRALLVIDKYGKYYDELTKSEHNKINHRIKAVRQLTKYILNLVI